MTTVPATTKTKLPAGIDLYTDAGKGSETVTMEDMVIPFIQCAQALSPQVNKRESVYIDGLEQGDFFNTATEQFWKGDTGFIFIPVLYMREHNEWKPREAGGGFQGKHDASIMQKVVSEERGGKWANYLPNGNTIAVTGTWYGLVYDNGSLHQAVLSLTSTQLKKSRQLLTKLKSIMVPGGPNNTSFNPALYYSKVKVTSVPESNERGNWFGWKFELDGNVFELPNGEEIYKAGQALLQAVHSGTVKAAPPPEQQKVDDEIPF